MPSIIHFHRYPADPAGTGCHHRIYQNYYDLTEIVNQTDIGVIPLYTDKQHNKHNKKKEVKRIISKHYWLERVARSIRDKYNSMLLVNALINGRTGLANPYNNVPLQPYKSYIEKHGKPKLCIVDYPSFLEIAHFNNENSISTIYLPQNIESFTKLVQYNKSNKATSHVAIEWSTELEMFRASQELLMISRLESKILKGLGFSTLFYPYLPVSEIRSRLLLIRKERTKQRIDKKLFLMVGSIFHTPTGDGFRWLCQKIKENGLPNDIKLIVGGRGGEVLSTEFSNIPGLEIYGSLNQDKLENLLMRASAMLIPQQSGFGSLTRIPEMACA